MRKIDILCADQKYLSLPLSSFFFYYCILTRCPKLYAVTAKRRGAFLKYPNFDCGNDVMPFNCDSDCALVLEHKSMQC